MGYLGVVFQGVNKAFTSVTSVVQVVKKQLIILIQQAQDFIMGNTSLGRNAIIMKETNLEELFHKLVIYIKFQITGNLVGQSYKIQYKDSTIHAPDCKLIKQLQPRVGIASTYLGRMGGFISKCQMVIIQLK
ncbi:hypothetical protein TTHERM_000463838 (macronuclear) [Tetrahymena thermophila SB210]|uniref:Uncharacterized protein n=1 Tax=Tetrahymena thermophila (strain SB210) TaxID=312017 RepID=W7X8N7_TETTS|nr:hypothetical protein TTHERM_000463838 [Tetrahymena thermophila SB210]EWS73717.1 hypothetical protein TTHERM_000463838 [Tetrahymena thermophila SB210]|eukprot:XP_012653755.1 hypothetical protein TTHERM_000463838 [Tetrahymena thermophila SB210]